MFITGWRDKEGNSITWQPLGMFPSPDGKEFSNRPYNKEQRKIQKAYDIVEKARDKVIEHLNRTDRSIIEEFKLVKSRKSTMPSYARKFITQLVENDPIMVTELIYYEDNPDTKMDVPSLAYEQIDSASLRWQVADTDLTLYEWFKKERQEL